MGDNSVIIIGAGLAGLAAGCYAQMNGYQAHIFEHHSQPGGVAAWWKRRDYLIDGGIHFVMGHKPGTGLYNLYHQLGIVPDVRLVELTSYGRFIHEASNLCIDLTQDLARLDHDLKTHFPGDHAIIDELINGTRAMMRYDLSDFGMSKPPELTGSLDSMRALLAMRTLLPYMMGRLSRPVAEYVRRVGDQRLRVFIESLFTPDVPVFFVMMLLAMAAGGQLGLIEGGCRDFVGAIEKRILALGGQITYDATVAKILVQQRGGRTAAVGVRLAGGHEQRAGAVVSAADGYSTIFEMLDGRFANERIRKRYATWRLFKPIVMASYGVAGQFPGQPAFNALALERPLLVGSQSVHGVFVRLFNYSQRFAPAGKTVVQVEFETEWDYWHDLHESGRAGYDAEKQRLASELLARLERHFHGIVSNVEVVDVTTPYTTWRYTLNRRGAWEGWLMTPEVFTQAVERTLPGLADFYMAGQWVMPGGGVPPCLYSGQHVAQLLCRRDGKRFRTSVESVSER